MRKLNLIMCTFLGMAIMIPFVVKGTPFSPVTKKIYSDVVAKPVFKVGNPYTIKGISYNPSIIQHYDELGIASWYGSAFHGKLTSNGEIFDKSLVTAASALLPLPSIVEVTNLENGKKILVRVNDRGPYASGRIIDLSEKAAEYLDFKKQGTAKVRVRLIPELSKKVAEQMPNYRSTLASYKHPVANNNVTEALAAATPVKVLASDNIAVTKKVDNNGINIESISSNSNIRQVNLVEPSSVKKYVPRGVFVQIGAFERNNTQITKDIDFLSKVGVVTLQNIDIKGKSVLRVRVGPYGSIDDASKVRISLMNKGYKDPRVVIEE